MSIRGHVPYPAARWPRAPRGTHGTAGPAALAHALLAVLRPLVRTMATSTTPAMSVRLLGRTVPVVTAARRRGFHRISLSQLYPALFTSSKEASAAKPLTSFYSTTTSSHSSSGGSGGGNPFTDGSATLDVLQSMGADTADGDTDQASGNSDHDPLTLLRSYDDALRASGGSADDQFMDVVASLYWEMRRLTANERIPAYEHLPDHLLALAERVWDHYLHLAADRAHSSVGSQTLTMLTETLDILFVSCLASPTSAAPTLENTVPGLDAPMYLSRLQYVVQDCHDRQLPVAPRVYENMVGHMLRTRQALRASQFVHEARTPWSDATLLAVSRALLRDQWLDAFFEFFHDHLVDAKDRQAAAAQLVVALLRAGRTDDARALLDQMRDQGSGTRDADNHDGSVVARILARYDPPPLDSAARWDMILECASTHPDLALDLLPAALEKCRGRSNRHLGALVPRVLETLLAYGHHAHVNAVVNLVLSAPDVLDARLLGKIIKALIVQGQLDAARDLFDRVDPRSWHHYSILMKAYTDRGQLAEAERLLDELLATDIPVKCPPFTVLIHAYFAAGKQNRDVRGALSCINRMLDSMARREVAMDADVLNTLLHGYFDFGLHAEAEALVDGIFGMHSQDLDPPPPPPPPRGRQARNRAPLPPELTPWRTSDQTTIVDEVTFRTWILGKTRVRDFDAVVRAYHAMQSQQLPMDAWTLTFVVHAMVRTARITQARHVVAQFPEVGHSPVFTAVIASALEAAIDCAGRGLDARTRVARGATRRFDRDAAARVKADLGMLAAQVLANAREVPVHAAANLCSVLVRAGHVDGQAALARRLVEDARRGKFVNEYEVALARGPMAPVVFMELNRNRVHWIVRLVAEAPGIKEVDRKLVAEQMLEVARFSPNVVADYVFYAPDTTDAEDVAALLGELERGVNARGGVTDVTERERGAWKRLDMAVAEAAERGGWATKVPHAYAAVADVMARLMAERGGSAPAGEGEGEGVGARDEVRGDRIARRVERSDEGAARKKYNT
ncbi:pentatricopeptide repeat domain-containing protein [Allomyces macrogynus ATCC 38327]|uniref:Pentatricopeptide repeat domain-containing protein n=1 Tax=Allomyces macrogynus (strain ATCC 38327) TaxID=578462 RepID=A0A0L0SHN0_ALLM3|nr:pentatricopeptide repeat domain-containing protein [Allomyces macrogynus ATCC 38327]|eukprot:KNE62013.1 pentatricopeptide repeat domain-containing protein [Allomyces macrogynus ATCC 38327]